tara:strand:+ start:639 stop:962 length:324 start_codon:yes stop_codon:yes gene_type:complete
MKSSIVFVFFFTIFLFFLSGCQVKEVSPYAQAKNPYSHLGVEGYTGVALTSCLAVSGSPAGRPVRARKLKDGNVVEAGAPVSQLDYFDCVDQELHTLGRDKHDKESD